MNQYGVRGYLTPDNLPETSHCRTFRIPDDVQWLSVFMGALLPLIYPENWQEYGELTQQESADGMLDVIWNAYESDDGECPVVPAPWWDTVSDADDEFPEGELTPWYGTALVTYASPPEVTFIERLGIWVIAGFIVYSGQPFAAISFLTIAPQFVIALKTGNLGAIVDLIVDASRVGRYDTYSAVDGIMRIAVAGNPDLDTHQIYVVKDDNPDTVVSVIRDELSPEEVVPPNRRYVVDDDVVQIRGADGEWGDNPGADPRSSPAFVYPVIDADDPACQSGANMSRWIENFMGTVLGALAVAGDVTGVASVMIALMLELGPFGIVIDLVFGAAFTCIAVGATAIAAAFTPEVYDELTCIFYCNVDGDGRMSPEQLTSAKNRVDSEIGGVAAVVLDVIFFLHGNVGMTNAGTIGDAPADCSGCACEWCYEWVDAEVAAGDWSGVDQGALSNFAGSDFTLSDGAITHIEFTIVWTGDGGGGDSAAAIWVPSDDRVLLALPLGDYPSPATFTWDGSVTSPGSAQLGANGAAGSDTGITITKIKIRGTGSVPTWSHGHNC